LHYVHGLIGPGLNARFRLAMVPAGVWPAELSARAAGHAVSLARTPPGLAPSSRLMRGQTGIVVAAPVYDDDLDFPQCG